MEPYQYNTAPPVNTPQKEEPKIEKRDFIFAILSFVVGYLLCEFILFGGFGFGVPAFFIVFYTVALLYLRHKKGVFNKRNLISLIPVAVILICFALFDNEVLRGFNLLALWLFAALNFIAIAVDENSPLFFSDTAFDILKTTFFLPFHNLDKGVRALGKRGTKGTNLLKILLTLVIISPAVLIIILLLASSDAGFSRLANNVWSLFSSKIWEYVTKIIFALLFAFPLFSFIYSLKNDAPYSRSKEGYGLNLAVLDTVITISALAVFCSIYLLYIAMQAGYLFSALAGKLPEGFTYAGYARRGFFELVAVAFINFIIILFATALSKRREGKLTSISRIAVSVLTVFTLLLIVTAISKMLMYVGYYGLTPLRVYTSWFLIMLAFVAVCILIKFIYPRFNFHRCAAVGVITLYLCLNLCNTDAIIASFNIAKYKQNPEKGIDITLFDQLSSSAVPQILTLRNDTQYGYEIDKMLITRKKGLDRLNWQNMSLAGILAKQSIEKIK
jgi:preprotein translocase subunit SecG